MGIHVFSWKNDTGVVQNPYYEHEKIYTGYILLSLARRRYSDGIRPVNILNEFTNEVRDLNPTLLAIASIVMLPYFLKSFIRRQASFIR